MKFTEAWHLDASIRVAERCMRAMAVGSKEISSRRLRAGRTCRTDLFSTGRAVQGERDQAADLRHLDPQQCPRQGRIANSRRVRHSQRGPAGGCVL